MACSDILKFDQKIRPQTLHAINLPPFLLAHKSGELQSGHVPSPDAQWLALQVQRVLGDRHLQGALTLRCLWILHSGCPLP